MYSFGKIDRIDVSSFAAILLKKFENGLGLPRWKVNAHPHVRKNGPPLRIGSLRGIPLGMAPIAVNCIKLGAAEFFLPFL
jgi:hypothetical protein